MSIEGMSFEPDTGEDLPSRRRAAPRMDLSLPGQFMSTQANHQCIVTNLSRTGLLMAIKEPIPIGADGYLRCGPIDHFMPVTRKDRGYSALEFEIPVTDLFVFGMRRFQEQFNDFERSELQKTAQIWAAGTDTPNR